MLIKLVNNETKDLCQHMIIFELDTNDLGKLLQEGKIDIVGSDLKLEDSKQEQVIYQVLMSKRAF